MSWYSGPDYKSYHKTVSDMPHKLSYLDACKIVQEYKSSKCRSLQNYGVPVAPNTVLRTGSSWEEIRGVKTHERWAKVRYWYTDIVTVFENGSLLVDYGGHYDSPSTKARINNLVGFHPAYCEKENEYLGLQHYGGSSGESDPRSEPENALRFFQWRPRQTRVNIPWVGSLRLNPSLERSQFGRVFFMGISWEELENGATLVNLEHKTDRYPGGVPLRAVGLYDFAHGCPMAGHEYYARTNVSQDGLVASGDLVKTRVVVDSLEYQERERVLQGLQEDLRELYEAQATSVRLAAKSALVSLVQSLVTKLSGKELPEKSSKLVNDWVRVIAPVAKGDQNITKLLDRCQRIVSGADQDTLGGQDYQAGLDKELSKAMRALEDLLVTRPGRRFSLETEQEGT